MLEASSHEGNFDAINTYDQAVISFGFIQFAGSFVGSFPILLAKFKTKYPGEFASLFQKYGIDIEYNYQSGKNNEKVIISAQLTIWDSKQQKLLRGIEAEKYLSSNYELLGVLVQSSKNKNMQKVQLEYSINNWAKPSLNARIGVKVKVISVLKEDKINIQETYIGTKAENYKKDKKETYNQHLKEKRIKETEIDLTETKISDILNSEKGIATIISLYINSPKKCLEFIRSSILQLIEEESASSKEKVLLINDEKIINRILLISGNDKKVKKTFSDRISKIQNSNLTYEE